MADVCIVCEAFLQSCLENLLCDECRKPAEMSIEKESAIDEAVEDTPFHFGFAQQLPIMKFQSAKNRTSRVKRKLIFWGFSFHGPAGMVLYEDQDERNPFRTTGQKFSMPVWS